VFCPKCGASNQDSARYCSGCGGQLPNLADEGRDARWNAPKRVQAEASSTQALGPGPGGPVDAHLLQSILVTICCCQIFGIVAIVFSALAMGKNSEGDYAKAEEYAKKANTWAIWGAVLGIIVGVIYALLAVGGHIAPTQF
jgi:hypothetical protein